MMVNIPDPNAKLAVQFGNHTRSYSDLEQDILNLSGWFNAQLSENETRLVLGLRSPYLHWVALLALLRLGKAVLSMDKVTPDNRATLETFHCVITHEAVKSPDSSTRRYLTMPLDVLSDGDQGDAQAAITVLGQAPLFEFDLAPNAERLILTSGSTGSPKLVAINAPQLRARIQAALMQYDADLSTQTKMLTLMGIDTIGGFLITLCTWLKGGVVLMGEPSLEGDGITNIPFGCSNLLSVSPARLGELLMQTRGIWPGRGYRVIRVGGSRLNRSVRNAALERIGVRVQTTYGSTELGLVASCDAKLLNQHPGAAGYVFAGAKVEIVGRDDQCVPCGHPGLIRCQTPGMATGYEGSSLPSAFRDGWFYSGDLGILHEDGLLVVTGRDSDVINLGGLKLSAVDLETVLSSIDGLIDVCVVGFDENGPPRLAVAVVHGDDVNLDELRYRIEQILPQKLPFHLLRVPSLHRNAMGKLPRSAITTRVSQLLGSSLNGIV